METVRKKIVDFFNYRSLRKFILLSIILAMLFLFCGMSISRAFVYSKVKSNMIETNEKYATALFKQIDTEMNVVNAIINNYINDTALNEITRCNESDYRFIELLVDASADISRTVEENLFVDDIVVVFDNKNVAFSKDGRFTKKYFLRANYYYEEIAKMSGQKNVIRTVPYFEKKGSTETGKVLLFSVPANGYTVNVMVSYKRLEEIFGQNITEGKKLVILSETDLIYNNTECSDEELFSSIGFREDDSDIKKNSLDINGEEHFDAYANLQSVGWTCHMLLPRKMLLNEINMVMNPFVYSYIVILLVMIFLVAVYRRKIVFPLTALLNDMLKDTEHKDNQSEFEMINSYITDMNFKNEKYTEIIENSTKRMQVVILKDNASVEAEMQDAYFGSMEYEKFLLLKFFVVSCDGDVAFIKEYIEDFLTREECFFTVFNASENSLFAVINCPDEKLLYEKVENEVEKIRLMGNDVFAVFSDAVSLISELSYSSKQIEQIFSNRNASLEKAVYTISDVVNKSNENLFENAGKMLQKCILDKGREETENCFSDYSNNKNMVSYSVYKKFLC